MIMAAIMTIGRTVPPKAAIAVFDPHDAPVKAVNAAGIVYAMMYAAIAKPIAVVATAIPDMARLFFMKPPDVELRDRNAFILAIKQPVLRPPAPPVADLQLSLASLPLAASALNLRLASAVSTPTRPVANFPARIGFVFSARPARTSDLHRLFRASGRRAAIHQARA